MIQLLRFTAIYSFFSIYFLGNSRARSTLFRRLMIFKSLAKVFESCLEDQPMGCRKNAVRLKQV